MQAGQPTHPGEPVPRRTPEQVMRLARLGCAHPTRLSFLRILLRRLQGQGWRFDRPVWRVDDAGAGIGVYRAIGPERVYSLIAFAHDLPEHLRSDRVIATAWDATFTLFDGDPSLDDIERLSAQVPFQEAGRISTSELSLSRANRSVRLFEHVVDRLSRGQQPDAAEIDAVGYLMRTTAVYGSGKFGAADRRRLAGRAEIAEPFQVEMLTVWLIRQFTVDIAEHLAAARGGSAAVSLDPALRRRLGVGNSTGLGMAPFIVRYPMLLNNWMMVREEALSRVRSLQSVDASDRLAMLDALHQARRNAGRWYSVHPVQARKLGELRRDLERIAERLQHLDMRSARPWDVLWRWAEAELSLEGQEALLSVLLEPYGELVDGMACCLSADESAARRIDAGMRVGELRRLLEEVYAWALAIDFDEPANVARFWYVSEEKLEPRLGDRAEEAGADREQPLCVARLAQALYQALDPWSREVPLAHFLWEHPEHRFMVRRAQIAARYPYAEVQDNLIAHDMLPIDLMRCKLAFFGASHFDPRSDRWVRISLFQGAGYPLDGRSDADHV